MVYHHAHCLREGPSLEWTQHQPPALGDTNPSDATGDYTVVIEHMSFGMLSIREH